MARENIDLENLTEADVSYIEAREWIIQEMEFQGHNWAELKAASGFGPDQEDSEDDSSDEDPEGNEGEDEGEGEEAPDYDSWLVGDLDDEIAERNEGREDDDLIASDGKKADKVAALVADDEAQAAAEAEESE